ncbi:uncharacterized protein AMSG_04784 [Thecamonas trahens ATCC 50062]|uniref:Uncharacterized protein n=1 Tax=Thecamonas trahens ATCC 50062 TaxID=461836 RepID=A0A0L0D7K3_THETB|nr:hypothetical protein AMSG_04784 [Thecamonas trahens ATCC 50062]KNC48334.1 hypothetical protein AMSG_04784 [Thecamonas trahens ATCC 50062]|eukprot:XP_013758459.1 hypothetical protein AMSG_04784 [Thecamonas trahens ATCC 50062]
MNNPLALLVALTLLVTLVAARPVAQCPSALRDRDCGACVSSFTDNGPCHFCKPVGNDPARCYASGTYSCNLPVTNSTRAQCPRSPPPPPPGCNPDASCPPSPPCAAGVLPTRSAEPNCCLSCRPPCEGQGLRPASGATTCAPGVQPTIDTSACTVSCTRPPICNATASIPPCSASTPPTIDTRSGCPSCRLAGGELACRSSTCSMSQCAANTEPSPDSGNLCCLTCRPRPRCDPKQCEASFDMLRACDAGEEPIFESDSCCPSCRIQDADAVLPAPDGTCTREQRAACASARPMCEPTETPVFARGSACCATCRRPLATCSLDDVAACATTIRDCEDGEESVMLKESCCPSCKPAAPSCAPACDESSQICGLRANATSTAPTCLNVDSVTFEIEGTTPAANTVLSQFAVDNVRALLLELVDRYCDAVDNIDVCAVYRDAVVTSARCALNSAAGATPIQVTCKVPSARTRSATSSATFLEAATTSDSSDYRVTVASGPSSTTSSAAALSPATRHAIAGLAVATAAVLTAI